MIDCFHILIELSNKSLDAFSSDAHKFKVWLYACRYIRIRTWKFSFSPVFPDRMCRMAGINQYGLCVCLEDVLAHFSK